MAPRMPISELVRGIHPRNHVAKFGLDPLRFFFSYRTDKRKKNNKK